mmetsp:Transcript_26609/g.51559  ORF Transcript_26609/g.51559 Transcript_26609/m.51559 type:complete len:103 (-) Transcript_26609:117-425(-)
MSAQNISNDIFKVANKGRRPYDELRKERKKTLQDIYKMIEDGKDARIKLNVPSEVGKANPFLKQIVHECLRREVKARPSAAELLQECELECARLQRQHAAST